MIVSLVIAVKVANAHTQAEQSLKHVPLLSKHAQIEKLKYIYLS